MKRFLVYIPAAPCLKDYSMPWQDSGFSVVEAGEKAGGELPPRPDVMFWPEGEQEKGDFWREAESLCPALLVILFTGRRTPKLPDGLMDIYKWQILKGEEVSFLVASRLEGEFCPPDWEAYRSGDKLTASEQLKAVAGAAYRLLLEDLFRETREWCGHTFSVVGPA